MLPHFYINLKLVRWKDPYSFAFPLFQVQELIFYFCNFLPFSCTFLEKHLSLFIIKQVKQNDRFSRELILKN